MRLSVQECKTSVILPSDLVQQSTCFLFSSLASPCAVPSCFVLGRTGEIFLLGESNYSIPPSNLVQQSICFVFSRLDDHVMCLVAQW